jgi:hypothetical protein
VYSIKGDASEAIKILLHLPQLVDSNLAATISFGFFLSNTQQFRHLPLDLKQLELLFLILSLFELLRLIRTSVSVSE